VLEGAGSPAEINLRDRDIVNMGMAEMAQCPVVLVADIDRGVFAAIYGTLALLQEHERWRVKGVIINKFRGDVALLTPGIKQIEALTGVPVLGVMPWLEVDLEDEDGVALQRGKYLRTGERAIDIAVVQLPHISNFTDFNALAAQPDVRVHYVRSPQELHNTDFIILPGSKNTLGDLAWHRRAGWRRRFYNRIARACRYWGSVVVTRCSAKPLSMRWNQGWARCRGWGCSIPSPILRRTKPPPWWRPPSGKTPGLLAGCGHLPARL
jgi:adenosylcobyric acid synthase